MRGFWRALAIFLTGGVLGTGFGVALGFFFYPFVFPPPPAMEQLTNADRAVLMPPEPRPETAPAVTELRPPMPIPTAPASPAPAPARAVPAAVATGTFIHANPGDPVHWGRGRVSVYERVVFLESDF